MRSVAQLSAEANAYEFNTGVSFRSWAHVSQTLFREACVYDTEDNPERAFVLYLRFADLALNRLPKHPQFHRNIYNAVRKRVPEVIDAAERLRNVLKRREEEAEQSRHHHGVQQAPSGGSITSPYESHEHPSSPQLSLHPGPNGTSMQDFLDSHDLELLDDLRRGFSRTSAHFKDVPAVQYPVLTLPSPTLMQEPQYSNNRDAIPVPQNAPLKYTSPNSSPSGELHTANGNLRKLFLPSGLRTKFLSISDTNTRNNIETCGILCGRLNRNAFFVTNLVIPDQIGTSDSCQTTNEEALFDFVESSDLFILGWIHTHPRQTCFMSSVDLHTHAGYQIMLPEAVALVLAPSDRPDWGAFRLTDPPGIDIIKHCSFRGFHPHPEPNIYASAFRPGHMMEVDYEFAFNDIRTVT